MILAKLRYIISVFSGRHFEQAVQAYDDLRPTLSVSIKRLEQGLSTQIYECTNTECTVTILGTLMAAGRVGMSVLPKTSITDRMTKKGLIRHGPHQVPGRTSWVRVINAVLL
jgi:LysR family hydrogen peroxide-inducible transcriptional activator